jgi:hypothetical protein
LALLRENALKISQAQRTSCGVVTEDTGEHLDGTSPVSTTPKTVKRIGFQM